jgi:hypothetical protein
MARWRVNAKHYVMAEQYGEPTEWVREEVNRDTGRAFRKTYKVPLFVDPEDPLCCNREGMCVLATAETAKPGDIVFLPPNIPTPDMEPLDDEAEALTAEWRPKWVNPIDGLPSTGEEFGMQILRALEAKISDVNRAPSSAPVSLSGAPSSDIEELKKLIAAQQAQINQLLQPKADDVLLDDAAPPPKPLVRPQARRV